MSWDITAGMRVVCVRDYTDPKQIAMAVALGVALPQRSIVYTVRDVSSPHPDLEGVMQIPIRLCEIINPAVLHDAGAMREPAWAASRFRPLDESRLDVFRNLLVDLPKEEELA